HLIDIAIASGSLLVADSPEDAEAILARGRALRKPPRYLLRIAVRAAEADQRGFGLEAREAVALAREGAPRASTPPEGLAFPLGTGIPGLAPSERAVREAAGVARSLASLGIPASVLDFGGGFASDAESRRDRRGRPRRRGLPADRIVPPLARLARKLL